jgi:hypothetical protein
MVLHTGLVRFAATAASAIVLTACAPVMHVSSYTERGTDLARYRTYDFAPPDRVSTGDPRLDNNPFFNERMQADIEKQMAAKGFEKSASPAHDLLIHYHASFSQRVDVNGIDQEYGYCRTGDCRTFVYDAGTLTVDFVEARTNRLVWRGWAEGGVDGVIDNQAWLEQKVDDAITRILQQLPGRL